MSNKPVTCKCLSHNGFLTRRGLAEAAQREVDCYGVDAMWAIDYVDCSVSVSGLRRDEDPYAHIPDQLLDEQARRFHNGS